MIFGQYELTPPKDEFPGAAAPSRGSLRIVARMLDLTETRQGPEYAESGSLEELALLETRPGLADLAVSHAPDGALGAGSS